MVNLYWHDAVLRRILVSFDWCQPDASDVSIVADFYKSEDSPKREPVELVFKSVSHLSVGLAIEELYDNAGAGHIVDAVVEQRESVVTAAIELLGGKIELHSESLHFVWVGEAGPSEVAG